MYYGRLQWYIHNLNCLEQEWRVFFSVEMLKISLGVFVSTCFMYGVGEPAGLSTVSRPTQGNRRSSSGARNAQRRNVKITVPVSGTRKTGVAFKFIIKILKYC